jgi:toxin-antitoxin system PIN domain toxin
VILPDVNVLVYAFRADSADHNRYRAWLDGVVNGPSLYAMAPQVLASVVRICSNSRVYLQPTPTADLLAFADLLLSQPNCRQVTPGAGHWRIYSDLCRKSNAAGNLTQDAWFAALAIEQGCEWVTSDRDFGRFAGLRWTLL